MDSGKKQSKKKGTLFIVGTPIGNLEDITFRAVSTLKNVDIILAEDTRQTLKLLNHFEIRKYMISYHRHNEDEKIYKVISFLDSGKNLALVSDAGMPIISDPGSNLVKYLVNNNYNIEVIPGVTALITAIVKSGFDSTRFCFEGFLAVNKKQRNIRINKLKDETRTMIFYEAPHKLLGTLKDIYEVFGNRNICIARELTKIHEEYINTNLEKAIDSIQNSGIKGEIVLLIQGINEVELSLAKQDELNKITNKELVLREMKKGLNKKEAIKKIAKQKNIARNIVYQDCIDLDKRG